MKAVRRSRWRRCDDEQAVAEAEASLEAERVWRILDGGEVEEKEWCVTEGKTEERKGRKERFSGRFKGFRGSERTPLA